MQETLTLCAVGDIIYDREEPDSMFTHVASILKETDITFGQLELPISLRGEPIPTARSPIKARTGASEAWKLVLGKYIESMSFPLSI